MCHHVDGTSTFLYVLLAMHIDAWDTGSGCLLQQLINTCEPAALSDVKSRSNSFVAYLLLFKLL